ncbi:Arc family DNA-binding protein [Yersinia enterocolitica]|uniref:Arc family DNA-binding protein n=1 Tax=Yersinia enterocolitica TaxID=630 RepID=UPI00155A68B1|nr:Arc family DNA-binding protein [Yersinia enterocolitica]ELI8237616.1 Arc family DNA-binding protein [Yersinia enterocolitica]MBX9484460.1 Arc family DNA-binding protein [Yersinia enterocolitica]NQS96630.1 Arc family DNA-binding protein [Yersinia enterocolitica]NQT45384.1 Arc family DNA-binding protein [Yersinia enterocolitica]NQU02001.1 Arc family DNA-binding protein [Yersinia enterocolitica]
MSREDPQLRIRLPIELKEKIEDSAKENNRSMNAEIVQRLDASYLSEIPEDDVISAQDALQIATNAKETLSNLIFMRTFAEINKKVRIGHKNFCIDLNDLELDVLSDDDFNHVLKRTFLRLSELGYIVSEKSLDSGGFIVSIPE